ncbi:MAG: SLC13 family permease [Candidatus Sigynarchaeota archaeon]
MREYVAIVLLLVIFVVMLYTIAKDVMERAAVVLICAVGAYLVVIWVLGFQPGVVVGYLMGTEDDSYANFHATALIFGVMVISTVCYRTGFFQFVAFQLIKLTKGKPVKVLWVVALLTFAVSSVLADSITAIIMIPLTVTVCKTLRLNPLPYIIIQSFCIKIGATVLPISSIPSLLIAAAQGISFTEYILSAGLISIGSVFIAILLFQLVFHFRLSESEFNEVDVLMQFNPWTFVKDKKMMQIAAGTFFTAIACFIVIPPEILKPDAIAIAAAAFLFIVNHNNTRQILKEIDYSLLLYLLGVFIVTGGLQDAGLIDLMGMSLQSIGVNNTGLAFLMLFWIGAGASAFIDNIPITQIMIPLINVMFGAPGTPSAKLGGTGLALGTIWGDNLSPFGDTILPLSIARNNKVEIQPKDFARVSTPLTLMLYTVISIGVLLLFDPLVGGIVLVCAVTGILVLYFVLRWRKGGSMAVGEARPGGPPREKLSLVSSRRR